MKKVLNLFLLFLVLISSFSMPIYALENEQTENPEKILNNENEQNNEQNNEIPNPDTNPENPNPDTNPDNKEQPKIQYGIVKSDIGIKVRSGAGTNYNSIGTGAANGQVLTVLETVNTTDGSTGCASGVWYKIKYLQVEESIGYACSNFVELLNIEVNSEFEASLLTFDESYKESLIILHAIYPNAVFVAHKTGIDFKEAVNNENILGKSLLWDTYPTNYRDGYKNLDSYDVFTNTFNNNYPGGGKNWYAANDATIAYYMDPRNFLTEEKIFMFESQSYNASMHTIEGVEKILAGSYMAGAYVDNSEITFAKAIMDAGKKSNISPYFIASRIIQEVGKTRSSLVLGNYLEYPEFNGYYNYYNIGAGGTNVVYNGLAKAKELGWNSEYKAIVEGSSWIGNNYINAGQDTTYFQKWNVVCKTGIYDCYTHQYMQNIEAPSSEASNTYVAYKNNLGEEMKNAAYVFVIPVFDNMPEKTSLPSIENPINYLSSLVVDKNLVTNFNPLVTNYEITIPSYVTSVNVEATSVVNGAKIEGVGNIPITLDKQVIKVDVTALNGSKLTYNITVNLNDDVKMSLSETLDNLTSGVITDNYLSGLTSVSVIKEAFNKANSAALVTVKDRNGNVINDGSVGTGYIVSITVGDTTKDLEIIIYGDINGDMEINTLDIIEIQREILKMDKLSGSKFVSSDLNSDGVANTLDIIEIQRHILEIEYIRQGR